MYCLEFRHTFRLSRLNVDNKAGTYTYERRIYNMYMYIALIAWCVNDFVTLIGYTRANEFFALIGYTRVNGLFCTYEYYIIGLAIDVQMDFLHTLD